MSCHPDRLLAAGVERPAADIIALEDEIQSRVLDEFGIDLQPELVFVGF